MKIVYLAPSGFDYGSSQITEGLWLLMQRSFDVDTFMCTDKMVHHGAKIEDLPLVTVEEAFDNVNDADMILMSTAGDMKFCKDTLPRILKDKKLAQKFVFLDAHDSNKYLVDPAKICLYLKRELRYPEANYLRYNNIRGFTFGVYDFHFDQIQPGYSERDINIAFVAYGGSSLLRKDCLAFLNEEIKKGRKDIYAAAPDDKQPLSIDEYRAVMRRSKMIINVVGAGVDTLRFWEAMGFGGVLCSNDLKDHLYVRNYPEPRRQAVYFSSWSQMLETCDIIVKDEKWWNCIRKSADGLIRKYHSTEARAKQLLELFEELR